MILRYCVKKNGVLFGEFFGRWIVFFETKNFIFKFSFGLTLGMSSHCPTFVIKLLWMSILSKLLKICFRTSNFQDIFRCNFKFLLSVWVILNLVRLGRFRVVCLFDIVLSLVLSIHVFRFRGVTYYLFSILPVYENRWY